MIFIIILIILLILFYLLNDFNKENFKSCKEIPTGPYKNKCTNISFKDNILYALCPKREPNNTFEKSNLDLRNCITKSNDCNGINFNLQGKLVCK